MQPFVDVETWRANRDRWVTAHVGFALDGSSPRAGYDRGHLEGAILVDLERRLSGPASPQAGRHPLPTPEHFAAGMAALGIGDEDVVVAYDDEAGVFAARLVWMLRATGHAAALLDGRPEEPRSTEQAVRPPAAFAPRPWPAERIAALDEVQAPGVLLLDARPRERFLGAAGGPDPRPGHIPGAVSLPCREHVGDDGRLVPDVRERLLAAGVQGGEEVVSSCGSGVTACHTLLALEQAGFAQGRLHPGSFSQWAGSGRPVATG